MSYIKFSKLIKAVLCSALLVFGTGCGLAANNTEPVQRTQNSAQIVKEKAEKSKEKIIEIKSYGYKEGDKYLQKYATLNNVKQIILVRQSDKIISYGDLFLFTKNPEENWELVLQCQAYLGKNGIDKKLEGDRRTPTGDYGFIMAFGAKDNPGSLIPYTKLTNTMYWCGDKEYYNQFVDTSTMNHSCSGNSEHLLSYIPQYNYALALDYNKENIYGKGSAIFLHCFGNYPFTMGCISIAEENMVKILKSVDTNARICIYSTKG